MSNMNLQHYQLQLLFPIILSNKILALLSLKLPFEQLGGMG